MDHVFHFWSSYCKDLLLRREGTKMNDVFYLPGLPLLKGMKTALGDLEQYSTSGLDIGKLYCFGLRVRRLMGDAMPKLIEAVTRASLSNERIYIDPYIVYEINYRGLVGFNQMDDAMRLTKNASALAITFRALKVDIFKELSKTANLKVCFADHMIIDEQYIKHFPVLMQYSNLQSLKFSSQSLPDAVFQGISNIRATLIELEFDDCHINSNSLKQLFGDGEQYALKSFGVTGNVFKGLFNNIEAESLSKMLANVVKLSFNWTVLGKQGLKTIFKYINLLGHQLVHLNLSFRKEQQLIADFVTEDSFLIPELLELRNMDKEVAMGLLGYFLKLSPEKRTPPTIDLSREWEEEDLTAFFANPSFKEDFENAPIEILGLPNEKETEAVTSLKKFSPDFLLKYHELKKRDDFFTKIYNKKLVIIDTEDFTLSKEVFRNMDIIIRKRKVGLHHLMTNSNFNAVSEMTPLGSQCLSAINKVKLDRFGEFEIPDTSALKEKLKVKPPMMPFGNPMKNNLVYSSSKELVFQRIKTSQVVEDQTLTTHGDEMKQVVIMKNSIEPTFSPMYARGADLIIAVVDYSDPLSKNKLQLTLQSLKDKRDSKQKVTPVLIVCVNIQSPARRTWRQFEKKLFIYSIDVNNLKPLDLFDQEFFNLNDINVLELRSLIKKTMENSPKIVNDAVSGPDIGILLKLTNEYPFGLTTQEVMNNALYKLQMERADADILLQKLKYWSEINLISSARFIMNNKQNDLFIFNLPRFATLVDELNEEKWKFPSTLRLKYDEKQLECLYVQNSLMSFEIKTRNIPRLTVGVNSFDDYVQGKPIKKNIPVPKLLELEVEPFEADNVFRKMFIHVVNSVHKGKKLYRIEKFNVSDRNAAFILIDFATYMKGYFYFSLNDEKTLVLVEVGNLGHPFNTKLLDEISSFLTTQFIDHRCEDLSEKKKMLLEI